MSQVSIDDAVRIGHEVCLDVFGKPADYFSCTLGSNPNPEALREQLTKSLTAFRDGKLKAIPASELSDDDDF